MATLISSTSSLALMVLSSSSRSFFCVCTFCFSCCVCIDFLGILHFIGWVRERELKKEKNLEMGLLE